MRLFELKMRLVIIIPAYNEEKSISSVLDSLRGVDGDVLVIDDGSTDSTLGIVKKRNVKILAHKKNLGKARSLIDGFNYAIKKNYDIVITMDGDGEHDPAYIRHFLDGIKNCDIVTGERDAYRSFFRKILNMWSSLWFGMVLKGIKDIQCGFRAIKVPLLKKMRLVSRGFEIEIEMLLEATRNNARIGKILVKSDKVADSKVKTRDYIKINNFFDRWIIRNVFDTNINFFKKIALYSFASIGLLFFRWFE